VSIVRIVVWPIAAASYLAAVAALVHWLSGTWSGAASMGMWFAVFVGAPSLVGYAGSIWWRKRAHGLERVEVAVGFAFPVVLLALGGLVLLLGKL
jgi:hypothetical protein